MALSDSVNGKLRRNQKRSEEEERAFKVKTEWLKLTLKGLQEMLEYEKEKLNKEKGEVEGMAREKGLVLVGPNAVIGNLSDSNTVPLEQQQDLKKTITETQRSFNQPRRLAPPMVNAMTSPTSHLQPLKRVKPKITEMTNNKKLPLQSTNVGEKSVVVDWIKEDEAISQPPHSLGNNEPDTALASLSPQGDVASSNFWQKPEPNYLDNGDLRIWQQSTICNCAGDGCLSLKENDYFQWPFKQHNFLDPEQMFQSNYIDESANNKNDDPMLALSYFSRGESPSRSNGFYDDPKVVTPDQHLAALMSEVDHISQAIEKLHNF